MALASSTMRRSGLNVKSFNIIHFRGRIAVSGNGKVTRIQIHLHLQRLSTLALLIHIHLAVCEAYPLKRLRPLFVNYREAAYLVCPC